MKIISEIFKLPGGTLLPQLYCLGDDDQVDRAVSDTLLNLIQLSYPHEDRLEELIALAQSNLYISPNTSLPDWGVNDTNIWLVGPMVKAGHVCISNENTEDFSEEDGTPQQFTYEQFRVALKHWREFKELIAKKGKENLVGQRFEVLLP